MTAEAVLTNLSSFNWVSWYMITVYILTYFLIGIFTARLLYDVGDDGTWVMICTFVWPFMSVVAVVFFITRGVQWLVAYKNKRAQ